MKRKKVYDFIMITLVALILINVNTYAKSIEKSSIMLINKDDINLKASKRVWKYKKENGKIYRRLYDLTEKRWLTDWIFVK